MKTNEFLYQHELSDLMNPNLFIRYLMKRFNEYHEMEEEKNEDVFEDYKAIITGIYPYVARQMNEEEVKKAKTTRIMK